MRIKNNKALPNLILKWSKNICNQLNKNSKTKRGRPPVYEDYLVVSALLLKVLKKLSLRELEEHLKEIFPKVPDFTTLWYRFKKLEKTYLIRMIEETAKKIMEELEAKEFHSLIADGTGFGYAETYHLRWKRGKELRQVSSHVKTEVLVGVVKGKAVVVNVNTGRSYSDENRLLMPMLESLGVRARYFVGDAYYGKSVSVLKRIKELGMVAVVPVRDTLRMVVRDPYRLWAKENYMLRRKVYKKRSHVERVIGIVKETMGDRDRTEDMYVASLYVLGRFVIYNLALLEELLLLLFRLLVPAVFLKAFIFQYEGYFSNRLQGR